MAKTKLETLSIDLLRLDGGTQARIKTHEDAVDDYAEVITNEGGEWPFDPIDVFHDGSEYFVADGFHRTLAAIRVKRASIPCRVHQGTSKDAKIFGMTANDAHGLRMSRADKRACVEWLLDYGGKLTQIEIAEKAGVDRKTVQRVISDRNENATMSHSTSKTQGKQSSSTSKPTSPNAGKASSKDDVYTTTTDDDYVPFRAEGVTEPTASIVLDALEKPVPANFRESHALGLTLMSIGRDLDKFRQKAKELSEKPGGEWLRLQNIDEYVRSLKAQFQDAAYHTVCPRCKGKGKDCKKCDGIGWVPDYLKGTI